MSKKLHYQSKCAILRKMIKENNIKSEYFIHNYGYIDCVNRSTEIDYPIDYCKTEYKGKKYSVEYFSGCFCPYIVEL